MPNSKGISSKAKNKSDNFVWSEDEVEVLLYKRCSGTQSDTNGGELLLADLSIETKYTDILYLFRAIPCIFVKKTRVGLR